MIALTRDRTPGVIDPTFHGSKRKTLALALLKERREVEAGSVAGHDWKSNLWKKAKDQLFAETGDKCAYCEASTRRVAYGDVEHYRPKSKYWWLAYCYDNYLVSCVICNQAFKSNKFPVHGTLWTGPHVTAGMSDQDLKDMVDDLWPDALDANGLAAFTTQHVNENANLVNPYFDDPDIYFKYIANADKLEVRLAPTGHPDAARKVKAAEADYGLNRFELRIERYRIFEQFSLAWAIRHGQQLNATGIALADQLIDTFQRSNADFAGMCRYFVRLGGPQVETVIV